MKLSIVTGTIDKDFTFHKKIRGEKFYLCTLNIDDGPSIPMQVSIYLKDSIPDGRCVVRGNLCTCMNRDEEDKTKLFTFFRAKQIMTAKETDEAKNIINVDSTVFKVFDMVVGNNGLESLTIMGKEVDEVHHRSSIHYVVKGSKARRMSRNVHPGDIIKGTGFLHERRNKSFEVIMTSTDITRVEPEQEEITESAEGVSEDASEEVGEALEPQVPVGSIESMNEVLEPAQSA